MTHTYRYADMDHAEYLPKAVREGVGSEFDLARTVAMFDEAMGAP